MHPVANSARNTVVRTAKNRVFFIWTSPGIGYGVAIYAMLHLTQSETIPLFPEGLDATVRALSFSVFEEMALSACILLSLPAPIERLYSMKTLIDVHKEGKFVVATDLLSNVADQGLSEKEARENLKRGLEEHYRPAGGPDSRGAHAELP